MEKEEEEEEETQGRGKVLNSLSYSSSGS